jgi:hypothetical protein
MNDYYWHLVAVTSERYERAARQARQAEQSFAVARGRASNLLGAMSVVLTAVIAVSMLDPGSVVIRAALAAIQCTLLVTQCADRIVFQANGLGRGLQRNVAHLPGNGFEQGLPAAKDGCAQTALKSYAFCTVLHTTKHGNATCQWHVHVVCFLCCFNCTPCGPSFAVDVVLSACWMILPMPRRSSMKSLKLPTTC